jgi:hypothetical protein
VNDLEHLGVKGYAQATSAQNTISTTTDLTSLSVTWTAVTSRRYRTRVVINSASQVSSAGYWSAFITNASNATIQQAQGYAAASEDFTIVAEIVETGLSGSTTRKARLGTSGGTINLNATGTRYIIVEDIGAA